MKPLGLEQISRLRAATPGCARVCHFNHAGASLPSQGTLDAMLGQLQREAHSGPMEAARHGAQWQEQARQAAARVLNTCSQAIAFASSGSAAWSMAFHALPAWQPGDRILVGRQEWAGNLACMAPALAAGARLEVIPCDSQGAVSVEALQSMLDTRVRLIALTWLPANGGLINPAAAIGQLARQWRIPYFIDAAQAVGQMPCDVQALGCDVLKAAGRKYLRGPRGTALLYIRPGFLEQLNPLPRDVLSAPWNGQGFALRNDARRFETSEVSMVLLAGLANALQELEHIGIDTIAQRIRMLSDNVRRGLERLPGVQLRDLGRPGQQSALIAFTLEGWDGLTLKEELARRDINIGANGIHYTPLDMQARGLGDIARIAVSYFNTEEEIERLLQALAELAQAKRS